MKLYYFAPIVLVAACQTTVSGPSGDTATREAAIEASSSQEILALGGRRLTEDEFRTELVGVTLKASGWTWNIEADGTASSRADDGSWDSKSVWQLTDNQYCRSADSENIGCSDVYELSGIYRFSQAESASDLAGWHVWVQ